MSESYTLGQRSFACICDESGARYFGCGFLVTPELVLSCAHVVSDWLKSTGVAPEEVGARVFVTFPFANTVVAIPAEVEHWVPAAADPGGRLLEASDCVLIRLKQAAPAGTLVGEFASDSAQELVNAEVEASGFPLDAAAGTTAYARFTNPMPGQRFELRSEEKTGRTWVRRGFSGAPVWRRRGHQIVGMIQVSNEEDNAYSLSVSGIFSALAGVKEFLARARRPAKGAAPRDAAQGPGEIKYYLINRDRQVGEIMSPVRAARKARSKAGSSRRAPHCFCLMGTSEDELQQFTKRVYEHTLVEIDPHLDGNVTELTLTFTRHAKGANPFERLMAVIENELWKPLDLGEFPDLDGRAVQEAGELIRRGETAENFIRLPVVTVLVERIAEGWAGGGETILVLVSAFEQERFDRETGRMFPYWTAFWGAVMQRCPALDVLLFVRVHLATGLLRMFAPKVDSFSAVGWRRLFAGDQSIDCPFVELSRPEPVSSLHLVNWIEEHVVKQARWDWQEADTRRLKIEQRCGAMKRATMRQVVEAATIVFQDKET